mmetsp:Transcript_16879/g.52604  ORF Transcript_16879/g.52604 Transcript_16879/m.52604 type:complete len:584 (+) Transcript_16879:1163-2914(+)
MPGPETGLRGIRGRRPRPPREARPDHHRGHVVSADARARREQRRRPGVLRGQGGDADREAPGPRARARAVLRGSQIGRRAHHGALLRGRRGLRVLHASGHELHGALRRGPRAAVTRRVFRPRFVRVRRRVHGRRPPDGRVHPLRVEPDDREGREGARGGGPRGFDRRRRRRGLPRGSKNRRHLRDRRRHARAPRLRRLRRVGIRGLGSRRGGVAGHRRRGRARAAGPARSPAVEIAAGDRGTHRGALAARGRTDGARAIRREGRRRRRRSGGRAHAAAPRVLRGRRPTRRRRRRRETPRRAVLPRREGPPFTPLDQAQAGVRRRWRDSAPRRGHRGRELVRRGDRRAQGPALAVLRGGLRPADRSLPRSGPRGHGLRLRESQRHQREAPRQPRAVRPRQPARVAREILEPQDGQPARPHHQRHCQVRRPRDQVRGAPDLAGVPRRRVHVPLPARREDQGRQGLRRHLHAGPDASGREGAARRDGEAGRVVEEPQAQGAQTGSRGRQSGRAGGPGRAGSGRRRVDGGENFPRRRVRGADRRAERRARLRRDPRVGRDARRRGDGRGALAETNAPAFRRGLRDND